MSADRRLREVLARKDETTRQAGYRIEPAVVYSVTAGAASDGHALVTVTWREIQVRVAYPAGSTFTVGQTVQLGVPGGGYPPFIHAVHQGTP